MCLPRLLLLTLLLLTVPASVWAVDSPRPAEIPADLWAELLALDERIAAVQSLRARFERHRHTPLLRRPLVSEGVVYVKGDRVRWETELPSLSTTLVRDGEVQIYQPEAKRLEVYALADRAEVLGGPMPRLTVMAETFHVASAAPETLFEGLAEGDAADALALRLTPRDEAMADEVETMSMLLDRETGQLLRLRIASGESQWTEYRFIDAETDVALPASTFELDLPSDVEVVRPMEDGA